MRADRVLSLIDAVATRDPISVVRAALKLADEISIEVLRNELEAEAIDRANAVTDAIERRRFGDSDEP
jgi:hypothetical protein